MPISCSPGFTNASIRQLTNMSLKKYIHRKQKFLAKPRLTAGLRKAIRVKNALFYNSDRVKYKFYRNKILSLTRLSKANCYQSFFDLDISDITKTESNNCFIITTNVLSHRTQFIFDTPS